MKIERNILVEVTIVVVVVELDVCQSITTTTKPIPQINDPSKKPRNSADCKKEHLLLILQQLDKQIYSSTRYV